MNHRTQWLLAGAAALLLLVGLFAWLKPDSDTSSKNQQTKQTAQVKKAYVDVGGGLKMYYEVHGKGGRPLVLLHGGLTTIDTSFATILPELSKSRQVIAIEQQAHGHTADIDRPLSYEQMATDTATLLKAIGLSDVDVFGYSDGGVVGLRLATKYPDLVHKLAINGSFINNDGMEPGSLEAMAAMPADFAPEPLKKPYDAVAPDPSKWPVLVEKVKQLGLTFKGWPAEEVKTIEDPVLIMIGDKDIVRPEHAVDMYRLIPKAQLDIVPNTNHFPGVLFEQPDLAIKTLTTFYKQDVQTERGH